MADRNVWTVTHQRYVMSGKELEALCEAAGKSFLSFAKVCCGLKGGQIRSLRAAKQIDFNDSPYAASNIDDMREEAARREE